MNKIQQAVQFPHVTSLSPFRPAASELATSCGSPHPQQMALQLAGLADIIQRFADLKVDYTEFACLRALVLFKPGQLCRREENCVEKMLRE